MKKINVRVIPPEKKPFYLNGDYIRLDDLLKAVGAVNTGGHAKIVIQNGDVLLNGEVCTARGKKLHAGDEVKFEHTVYSVSAEKAL